MIDQLRLAIKALEDDSRFEYYGLCGCLLAVFTDKSHEELKGISLKLFREEILNPLYKTWVHYSGSKYYPVPAPKGSDWKHNKKGYHTIYPETPQGLAEYAYNTLPAWEGEYGQLRNSLAKHLILGISLRILKETRDAAKSNGVPSTNKDMP